MSDSKVIGEGSNALPGTVQQVDVKQLFNLLDDNDLAVVRQSKQLIQENLQTTKESWMISMLLDYYLTTHSDEALKILSSVNEQHEKVLLDKLHESMKCPERQLAILRVVLYAIGIEPTWLYHIGNTPLFSDIIKCVKFDTDVPVLMTALTILSALLPVLPKHTIQYLQDFFEIFGRVATFCCQKPGNVPEIFLLHLQASLYAFFHRLYGIFPCNFLNFLRKFVRREENRIIYKEIVKPMLERVRFNPLIITGSKEMELVSSRWHSKETHDIIASCASLILDPIEGTMYKDEDIPTLFSYQRRNSKRTSVDFSSIVAGVPTGSYKDSFLSSGSLDLNLSTLCQPLKGDVLTPDPMLWWSPSLDMQLTTPPVSQIASAAPSKGGTPISTLYNESETPVNHHGSRLGSCELERGAIKATPVSFSEEELKSSPVRATFELSENSLECNKEKIDFAEEVNSPSDEKKNLEFSVQTLNNIVENFITNDQSDVCDVEVEELTSQYPPNAIIDPLKFSSVSDSEIPGFLKPSPCEKLSSESVKQFKKKVNRIRFTSMTGETDVDNFLMQDRSQSIFRSRSCPNLFVAAHSMDTSLESKSISSASGKVDTKLVQVENAATQTEDPNLISSFTDDQSLSNMSEQHCELFNLYHFLLSPSPFSLCLKCKKPIDVPTESEDAPVQTVDQSSCSNNYLSPVEMLDKLLTMGAAQHAKELNQIPLASQSQVSWTHFGGSAPADEVNILRNQILLMQNQLTYERFQREGFAKLACRKQINASHIMALKEQNTAVLDQLRLQERETCNLQETVKRLQKTNCQLKQAEDKKQHSAVAQLKVALAECEELKAKNQFLNNTLSDKEKMAKEDRNNLQEANQKLFQAEKRLELMEEQVADKEKLKEQMFILQKELLLMGELQRQYQEKLEGIDNQCTEKEKRQDYVNALEAEMKDLRQCLQQKEVLADNWKTRYSEHDENLKSKDVKIDELKKCLDGVKCKYSEQIKVTEAKCESVMKVNQNLQNHILILRGEIEVLKKKSLGQNELLPESIVEERDTTRAFPTTREVSTECGLETKSELPVS